MPQRQWIQDHYWDEDGNELPIHPNIELLLKKFNLNDQSTAIFDPHSQAGKNFEAFASRYRIPGSHMGRVEQRYLDLYHRYIDMKRQKVRDQKAAVKQQKQIEKQSLEASLRASQAARQQAARFAEPKAVDKPSSHAKQKSVTTNQQSVSSPKQVSNHPTSSSATKVNEQPPKSRVTKSSTNAMPPITATEIQSSSTVSHGLKSIEQSAVKSTNTNIAGHSSVTKSSALASSNSAIKSQPNSVVDQRVTIKSENSADTNAVSATNKSNQPTKSAPSSEFKPHIHPKAIQPTQSSIPMADIDAALNQALGIEGITKPTPASATSQDKVSHITLKDQQDQLNQLLRQDAELSTKEKQAAADSNEPDLSGDDLAEVLDVSSTDKQLGQAPIKNLFEKLAEPHSIGFLRVNRKLADEGQVNVALDRNLTEFQRASFSQFLPTPMAQELLNDLSYRDLNATFTMYSACVMGLISKTYFQQWCQGQVFERIKDKPTALNRFQTFKSIQQAIYDGHSDTKLTQAVRWYLLMITIEPHGTEAKNNNQQNQQFYELRDLLYANMGMINGLLALEDPKEIKNAIYGQPGKSLRGFLHANHDQLVKPYLTTRNGDIQKNRFKK